MRPLQIVERAQAPDNTEFTLGQRGEEWLVSAGGRILMTSRTHHSEDELARLAIERVAAPERVLIGGLGMGFTAAAALRCLTSEARVTVAELVPALVEWNRTHLSALAGNPLQDPRCNVETADVFDVIGRSPATYDVILLDVDNGPIALSSTSNLRLYSARGLRRCLTALRPGGVLGVWSAAPSEAFEHRLQGIGVRTEVVAVPAHPGSRAKHTLFFTHARSASDPAPRAPAERRAAPERPQAQPRERRPRRGTIPQPAGKPRTSTAKPHRTKQKRPR